MVVVAVEETAEAEVVAAEIEAADSPTEVSPVVNRGPAQLLPAASPAIRVRSILTYPLESGRGAGYITAGGNRLIFVQNPPPVHGKMYLRQDETGTSPAVTLHKLTYYFKTFIPKKAKKYKRLIRYN